MTPGVCSFSFRDLTWFVRKTICPSKPWGHSGPPHPSRLGFSSVSHSAILCPSDCRGHTLSSAHGFLKVLSFGTRRGEFFIPNSSLQRMLCTKLPSSNSASLYAINVGDNLSVTCLSRLRFLPPALEVFSCWSNTQLCNVPLTKLSF